MTEELLWRPAVELARMVADREVSPVELTSAALRRIDRLDRGLGAFATVDHEGALAAARSAEAAVVADADLPPFCGVPTAIKDLSLTAGLRTTFGTASMADFVPTFDDEHVARLRRAGFVFVGKTSVPEFGTVPYTESRLLGPARNPWDPAYSAGGSSGGAAAAVAAGLVPVAHGSDGGGSVRIPASACGVFGLKPSRGRISAAPLIGEQVGGLSTPGPLARHVADAAAMLDVMQGYVPGDPYWAPPPARSYVEEAATDPKPLRIGFVVSSPVCEFAGETLDASRQAAALFTELGHEVDTCAMPVAQELVEVFTVLWTTGVASLPVDAASLEPFNRDLYEQGAAHSGAEVASALMSMHVHARTIVRSALAYDVLVFPVLTRVPLRVGEHAALATAEAFAANAGYVGLTPVANMTGQPAMSLPLGRSAGGLPIGVGVLGAPGDEATLFRLAGQVERASAWPRHRPPFA
jgi:amidase